MALDLTGLNDRQYAELDGLGLEKHLVLRRIQEGFAVVARLAQPDFVIRVEVRQNAVTLRATRADHTEVRDVEWDRSTKLDWVHLELSQKVVELARTTLAADPRTGATGTVGSARPESEVSALLKPRQSAVDAVLPSEAPAKAAAPSATQPVSRSGSAVPPAPNASSALRVPRLGFRLAGGAMVRVSAVDPLARLDLALGISDRWHLELGASLISSTGSGMRVLETKPTAGVGADVPIGATWVIGAAIRAGVLIHHYTLNNTSVAPASGTTVDGLVELPLHISMHVLRAIWLDLAIAPAVATRGRSHFLDGECLWRRGLGQLETTLGVAVTP